MRRCDETFDCIGGAQLFYNMDLKTGFHQVRVRLEDVEKIHLKRSIINYNIWYLVLPMGICDARKRSRFS